MGDGLPDWINNDAPVFIRYEPDSIPEDAFLPCIRRGENEKPDLSPEQEYRRIREQVDESEGFDIDYTMFRCVFNYLPVDLDGSDYVPKPETSRELMDRLSRDSLDRFNENKGTEFEFVKVVKANLHPTGSPVIKYFITFEAKDPSNDESKCFQAKVSHFFHEPNKYISCNLKPDKKVHSIGTANKDDAKKPRLTV